MDMTSVIIGIIVLSLFAWPFWLTIRKNKQETGGILDTVTRLAKEHQARLSHLDRSGRMVIGMDQEKGLAFFSGVDEKSQKGTWIDLQEFTDVKVNSRYLNSHGTKTGTGHPDEVVLRLTPLNPALQAVEWKLYSSTLSPQLNNELLLARKWEKLLKAGMHKERAGAMVKSPQAT